MDELATIAMIEHHYHEAENGPILKRADHARHAARLALGLIKQMEIRLVRIERALKPRLAE